MPPAPEVGDVVLGEVVELHPSGALVRLAEGAMGFLHASEMCPAPDDNGPMWVTVGEQVLAKVIGYDRMGRPTLSLRRVTPEDRESWAFHKEAVEFRSVLQTQTRVVPSGEEAGEAQERIERRLKKWIDTTQAALAKLRRKRAGRPKLLWE